MELSQYSVSELTRALKSKLAEETWLSLVQAMLYTNKSPATLHRYASNKLVASRKTPIGVLLFNRHGLDELIG